MVGLTVSLPVKWEQFLKQLADDHEIDLSTVVSELMRLIPQKEKLKKKQELQEKRQPRKKKSAKKNLKRNPTNIAIS